MIPIARPCLGEEEKAAVCAVIDSGMIACGKVTEEFESEFSKYIGGSYGVATTSGTTALEVALRALGLGPGDKVLTTPFSFIASTNSILYAGATPVFAEIDPATFNLDPKAMEEVLQKQPDIKALLIVHLFGQACNMDRILPLVKKYNLLLIEDCAQSHGALWRGQKVGSFGDAAAFSFYPTKNMTTSEGGMVVTNRDDVYENAKLLINHGMRIRYYHDQLGYNYRMTNLAAAIGLCQLQKLETFNTARRRNADLYRSLVKNPLIQLPFVPPEAKHVYHQFTVKVAAEQREALIRHLEDQGIGYGIFYPLSIPEQKCYREMDFPKSVPVTDRIKKEVLSLPVHPSLSPEEIRQVADVLNQFVR